MVETDSLAQVIAQHETTMMSLRNDVSNLAQRVDSLAAAVPDTVRDTVWAGFSQEPTGWFGTAGKDWFGWGVTVMGFVVAALIARAGWNSTAKAGRNLQKRQVRADRDSRRTRLIMRVRETLEKITTTARSTLKKPPTRPINPETMNGILVAWRRYDRVSDDLGLLDDPWLQDQLETVLDFARMTAEKVMGDENGMTKARDTLGEVRPEGLVVHASILKREVDRRSELHGLITQMRDVAQPVLEAFNKKFPPLPTHREAKEPSASHEAIPTIPAET